MPSGSGGGWNLAAWLGPPLALVAAVSYFTLFLRWPATRDLPWLNLLLLAAALGLSARGVQRGWPGAIAGRIGSLAGLALSAVLSLGFLWYVFALSAELPSEEAALAIGEPVPALSLLDDRGARLDLAAAASPGPLVLVFYRGFW
jgi:hypothetical protein